MAPILYQEGIRIDSSACYGHFHTGDGMYYDYRKIVPNSNCHFSREHTLNENIRSRISGGILEIPVASYGTFPYRVIASRLNKKITSEPPNGHGMALPNVAPVSKRTLAYRIKNSVRAVNMVTFDSFNAASMSYMLRRIYKEMDCRKNDVFIATIAHPKVLSKDHIENMKISINKLKNRPYIKFVNMRQIAELHGLL